MAGWHHFVAGRIRPEGPLILADSQNRKGVRSMRPDPFLKLVPKHGFEPWTY